MSASTEKAKTPTARQVAASLKALGGRLVAVVDKLNRAGDVPVPADAAKELSDLAAAMRAAGIEVAQSPADMGKAMVKAMGLG